MKDFRTRKTKKTPFIYSWFFLFILLVILILFARSTYASFIKKKNAEIERIKYEEQVQELIKKKESLELRIENLKTERGVEEELRKLFDIRKDGETMIRIVEKPTKETR